MNFYNYDMLIDYKWYPKIQSLLNILTHQNKINSNKSLRKRREKQKDEENNVKFNNEFLAKLDLYIQKSKDEGIKLHLKILWLILLIIFRVFKISS